MRRRAVLALAATAGLAPVAKAADTASAPPKRYFVLMHAPGPKWDHTKGFGSQDGIDQHVNYMGGFLEQGRLLMGGPFLDNSGGMMIFDVDTQDEAQVIADADPTVKGGLLTVTVKPWLAGLRRA